MLNSPRPLQQAPAGVKPREFGLRWKELSDAIIAFHQPIAHHFYTGVGLKLQRLDSDIAEMVMLHFAKMNYGILPLHDSFLMHNGFENELPPIMSEAFQKIVGSVPKIDLKREIKKKVIKDPSGKYDFGAACDLTVKELLEALDVGHQHRLEAFREMSTKR